MNSYALSRQWFDFAFENPSKVKPIHGSLYLWLVELANRLGWPSEFGNPGSQCMAACGISSYNTYKKAFDELVSFGFVEVKRKSVNQYQSCIIALLIIDKAQYKALDKALAKHYTKHLQSTIQSTDSINKPLNQEPLNQEPLNLPLFPSCEGQEESFENSVFENDFLKIFIELTGRNFKGLSDKAKRQLAKLKKKKFTPADFKTAIINGYDDSRTWSKPSLFTPEFITREDKFLQYLIWETKTPPKNGSQIEKRINVHQNVMNSYEFDELGNLKPT